MNNAVWKMLALCLTATLALWLAGCPTTPADDDDGGDDDGGDDDGGDDDGGDDDGGDDDGGDDDSGPEYVVIVISSLTSSAQYYTWDNGGGVIVEYFALMGGDGDPHVAFDACEVCYSAGLGYSHSNQNMVCNNCGNSYPINSIGTENQGGGCWPGYLPITIDGDEILIDPVDLQAGAWLFP